MGNKRSESRFYERYQVEDVLTFITRQLVQAKTVDGSQIYIQEIKTKGTLPPGTKEMLANLQHRHVAPVHDVTVERGRITLIHPPFAGDPLPLLVSDSSLRPAEALDIFYKLLNTMEELSRLPIPLTTTLDPKNICVSDEPYLLFYWVKKYSVDQPEEKWRGLLYYMLTGEYPTQEADGVSFKDESSVPEPLRELALYCLDTRHSRREVLARARELVRRKDWIREEKQRRWQPFAWRVEKVASLLAVIVLGGWMGYQIAFSDKPLQVPFASVGSFSTVTKEKPLEKVTFNDQRTHYRIPGRVDDKSLIYGEFRWKKGGAFSTVMTGQYSPYRYELEITKKGEVVIAQYDEKNRYQLLKSDSNQIRPGRTYHFEMLYVPNEPLHFSIRDNQTNHTWIAAGPVPLDSIFQVDFKGAGGTELALPGNDPVDSSEKAHDRWMGKFPWYMIDGYGIRDQQGLSLKKGKVEVMKRNGSFDFAFVREKENSEPLHLEMESVDGVHYTLVWKQSGMVQLYRSDNQNVLLLERSLPWKWEPRKEARVSVINALAGSAIIIQQGNQKLVMDIPQEEPISLREVRIVNEDPLKLVQPPQNQTGP
jgi:hypothetical protein